MDEEKEKKFVNDVIRYALETTDAQSLYEYLLSLGYSAEELAEFGM